MHKTVAVSQPVLGQLPNVMDELDLIAKLTVLWSAFMGMVYRVLASFWLLYIVVLALIAIIVCKLLIFSTLKLQQFSLITKFSDTYISSNSRYIIIVFGCKDTHSSPNIVC